MLTGEREDVLTELVNIGIGRAAYTLSEMVDSNVGLRVPRVSADHGDAKGVSCPDRSASVVLQSFSGGVAGTASLVIPLDSARRLVAVLTNAPTESEEIDAEREGVITEVGNIVINAVLGSFGNLAALDVVFGLPRYEEALGGAQPSAEQRVSTIRVSVLFQIQTHSIEGELSVCFELPSLDGVWSLLLDADVPGQVSG